LVQKKPTPENQMPVNCHFKGIWEAATSEVTPLRRYEKKAARFLILASRGKDLSSFQL